MKRLTTTLAAVLIGVMATTLWSAEAPEAPKPVTVKIDNFRFSPNELTIPIGTTVTWVNEDDVPHTATSKSDPPAFDSKALDTDQKFSFKFAKAGTYKYFCKLHNHMTATVIVK